MHLVVAEDWNVLLGHFKDGAWLGIPYQDGPGIHTIVIVGGPFMALLDHQGIFVFLVAWVLMMSCVFCMAIRLFRIL